MSWTTPALVIGGAAAIGGILWWRARQRKAADDARGGDAAAALCRAAGLPAALCDRAGGLLAAAVDATGATERPFETNERLNGEAELVDTGANAAGAITTRGTDYTTVAYPLATSGGLLTNDRGQIVYRFKNGCVPIEGHAGWSKCAPGTMDMRGNYVGGYKVPGRNYFSGAPWKYEHHTFGTPSYGNDPMTRKARTLADGSEEWWDRGVKRTCPPGTTIRDAAAPLVQDHRPGAPSYEEQFEAGRCKPKAGAGATGPIPIPAPPPPAGGYVVGERASGTTGDCREAGPNYEFRDGVCRRRAA